MSGAQTSDTRRDHYTDLCATAVLSGNRNLMGVSIPTPNKPFYLTSLVVAYAIAGTIRFDIERDILGTDQNGEPVRLADIWPSDEEIDAIVSQAVKPEQFSAVAIRCLSP